MNMKFLFIGTVAALAVATTAHAGPSTIKVAPPVKYAVANLATPGGGGGGGGCALSITGEIFGMKKPYIPRPQLAGIDPIKVAPAHLVLADGSGRLGKLPTKDLSWGPQLAFGDEIGFITQDVPWPRVQTKI